MVDCWAIGKCATKRMQEGIEHPETQQQPPTIDTNRINDTAVSKSDKQPALCST